MLIKAEVAKWSQKGVNIVYRHRLVRTGYKAGNLKSAMSCDYVRDYEFVAIFDADFQPNPDFLKLTVPHFKVETTKHTFFPMFFVYVNFVDLPVPCIFSFCRITRSLGWFRPDGLS